MDIRVLARYSRRIEHVMDGTLEWEMNHGINALVENQEWELMSVMILTASEVPARRMAERLAQHEQYLHLILPACFRRQIRKPQIIDGGAMRRPLFRDLDALDIDQEEGIPEHIRQDAEEMSDAVGRSRMGALQRELQEDNDGIRDKMINGEKKKLSLRFVVYEEPGESVRVNTANQIKSMLGGLGIECRVDSLGFSDALARLKAGTFDLALAAFNVDPVPDPGFLLISGNTGNYMRYKSDRMDKLFTDLRATLDRDAYQLKLLEIQALMVEDCPLISLYYRNGAIISRRMFSAARDLREPDVLRGLEKGPTPGR